MQRPPKDERAPAARSAHDIVGSAEFKALVSRRWAVSALLTLALFVLYYGYLLLLAHQRGLLARRLDGVVPLAIPLGAGVIVGAWVLTALYVAWANRAYDGAVERLKRQLRGGP